jgi:O-methyltransferase
MSKMKHPANCIVKAGYFPDTAEGLEDERYCFVSIDADLYNPIYEGLKYFYPRLSKGGYLFVHDYNRDIFKGAKEAVRQYCAENGLTFFPLTDSGGSAVLTK